MARPTFLVAEPEPEQALSARKLVLETAKFNVITSHSGSETRELLQQFPNVQAVIVHSQLRADGASVIVNNVKQNRPELPVILLSPAAGDTYGAEYQLSSHEPQQLLDLLRKLFGDPRRMEPSQGQ